MPLQLNDLSDLMLFYLREHHLIEFNAVQTKPFYYDGRLWSINPGSIDDVSSVLKWHMAPAYNSLKSTRMNEQEIAMLQHAVLNEFRQAQNCL